MSITKQLLKTKPEYKIRFCLTAEDTGHAGQVAIVGEFNEWAPLANLMRRQKNGDFVLDLNLPVGSAVKFRYLADGDRWLNDPQADGYEYCTFAQTDNSLLNL